MPNALSYNEAAVFNRKKRVMPSVFCRLTPFLRITPDFFLAGVQKGGTTSLYSALIQHPQIIPAKNKEIFYYSITSNYEKGKNYYRQFFATNFHKTRCESRLQKNCMTFDATTNTFDSEEAPERIIRDNPNAKIIFMFRDPVERAFSHYKFSVKRGFETADFEKALELEQERIKNATDHPLADPTYNYVKQRLGYFTRGIYANHIENWLKAFAQDNLHIIKSEDFFLDPQKIYNEVTDFLGLERNKKIEFEKLNESSGEKMKPETRESLRELYKSHNERFFELIKKKYDW